MAEAEIEKSFKYHTQLFLSIYEDAYFVVFQSQPCHWRNAKSISKRSTDENAITQMPPISQNISLYQSLRVLQEGEAGEETATTNSKYLILCW